jgi:hypothetical protein
MSRHRVKTQFDPRQARGMIQKGADLAAPWSFKQTDARNSLSTDTLNIADFMAVIGTNPGVRNTGRCPSGLQCWGPPSPSLTLLSSGVGGRGFFEAETNKQKNRKER